MLGTYDVTPTLAVRDLAAARAFYEGKLGLTVADDGMDGAIVYKAGATALFVYVSEFAGTNQATAVSWAAGPALVTTIAELRAKGVAFEHYDLPGLHLEGDIHVGGGMRLAWFKDPDGNIHALSG
ncbi:glyoxalase [Kaistia algarum]|uniref:VOC family protein n=1 Tax=Kaistia algarum TaxID=2083279 RepID=UPI000CE8A3E1|nr:VOC family protein [Kaistia algarum]MCX5512416.1 VOC family protein [Kaistia algarum]PPE80496.1 glyoxalase [Kaistia algarum]